MLQSVSQTICECVWRLGSNLALSYRPTGGTPIVQNTRCTEHPFISSLGADSSSVLTCVCAF